MARRRSARRHRRAAGRYPRDASRTKRLIGASTTSTMMPMAVQAVRQPVCSIMCCTQGSKRHRADADAGKGEPHRQPAAADEPVRQKQRLAGIAEADAAGADQHADGEIEMPGLRRQRRQQQPSCHQRHPKLHHPARTKPVHHPADQGTDGRGDHEAEREGPRGDAALPAELIDDRRKEQRERGARIDADRHGHEGDDDDDPAVEEGKAHKRGDTNKKKVAPQSMLDVERSGEHCHHAEPHP